MRTTCGTIFAALLVTLSAHGAFNVRNFGAKGDGMTMDTSSIQSAIDKCGESGGGRVVLANGTFLSGSIRLRTGVELHIDGTARLLASPDIADFPEWKDVRHVKSENLPRGRNACFIFAEEADRISIGNATAPRCGSAFKRRRLSISKGLHTTIRGLTHHENGNDQSHTYLSRRVCGA